MTWKFNDPAAIKAKIAQTIDSRTKEESRAITEKRMASMPVPSEATLENAARLQVANTGSKRTPLQAKNISEGCKLKPRTPCKYCSKMVMAHIMARCHGEKCKWNHKIQDVAFPAPGGDGRYGFHEVNPFSNPAFSGKKL